MVQYASTSLLQQLMYLYVIWILKLKLKKTIKFITLYIVDIYLHVIINKIVLCDIVSFLERESY